MSQAFRPDLSSLQQAIDNVNDNDSTALIPFINAINDFPINDKATATALLRSIFWTEKSKSNTYEFTDRFKLLTAKNLSIIINKIGDKNIAKFIFIDNNKNILGHYPINDLIDLLGAFYHDRFAYFVFNQFKDNFLKSDLSCRVKYFETISVAATITILKTGGIGRSLSNDELLIIIVKMKTYLISNKSDNTWLDCQKILPEIIKLMIGNEKNIKKLSIQNLQAIVDNDLIIKATGKEYLNLQQTKRIINELFLRQKKSVKTSSKLDIKKQLHCDKLIGILSTENFACFQQPVINKSAILLLDGPLVMMPMNKKHKEDCINYSVLVQIQDLNSKGSIFLILLKQIPNNYEVVLSVSNSFNTLQIEDLNIGMNNTNPICTIPWPLPKIGQVVSFRLHCTVRPIEMDENNVKYGIDGLRVSEEKKEEKKEENENDDDDSGSSSSKTGNKMVMCIYSGGRNQQNQFHGNMIPWINIMIYDKMTFHDMLDAVTAQLGLPPPNSKDKDEQKQFGFFDNQNENINNKIYYIVRNQMGHKCELDGIVIEYLDKMVMNSNLFPVFVFTKGEKDKRGRGASKNFGGIVMTRSEQLFQ